MNQPNQPSQPQHPSDELIALALSQAPAAERARAEARLDETSRAQVQRLRSTLATLADSALESAPASLVARLVALGRVTALDAAVDAVASTIRRLIATITFDSRVSPALAGFRGSADGRQLVYSSQAGDVHLRFTGPDDADPRVTIRGSVEPADASAASFAGATIRLGPPPSPANTGPAPIEAMIDDDGMFLLRTPPGTYPVVVRLADTEIDLGLLDVA